MKEKMKASDYIVDYLIHMGVTDVFGIPGGVILEFLYAVDRRKNEIAAHLSYHEQAAGFAACGYAQVKGTLGVAYATRGPGVTNMVTAVADAYFDSIPVLFITAHASNSCGKNMRTMQDQEFDALPLMGNITKYAARVDRAEDIPDEIRKACGLAMSGRKGPVFLDFHSSALCGEVEFVRSYKEIEGKNDCNTEEVIRCLEESLEKSKRPILLIGDGVSQSGLRSEMKLIAKNMGLPVLSSRFSQDIMPEEALYYGYIGSHGTRYGNFILSKADLIIALGNRMSFPVNSKSFRTVAEHAKIIRVDIDSLEFIREIPNSSNFSVDLKTLLPQLAGMVFQHGRYGGWISVCNELKEKLHGCDISFPVAAIAQVMDALVSETILLSDVGNHEFWVSRAYAYAKAANRVLYSKSFGVLGCALGKAIGAYYSTHQQVVCFVGDQGLQMNIQELQFISCFQLPIVIVLLNNFSSGMIRSKEKQQYGMHFVHTTVYSGYSVPNFEEIVLAYGIKYYCYKQIECGKLKDILTHLSFPCFIEIQIDETIDLEPNLPKANLCQNLIPLLPNKIYDELDNL